MTTNRSLEQTSAGGAAAGTRRVAVLGAGTVGRTLATGWARAGHRVVLGSRDPSAPKIEQAVADITADSGGVVTAMRHAEAARAADVAVIAVPGDQVTGLVAALGDALDGRVVIDTTNNTADPVMNSIAALKAAGANAFRAFNSVGWEQMRTPVFGSIRADMPYTGGTGEADDVVAQLITDIGFRPIALGDDPDALAAVDALARLWFLLAFRRGHGRRVGFRILTADDDESAG